MSKEVRIVYTEDEWDCETCGSSYEQSYQLFCGDKEFGVEAKAHCTGSESSSLEDVLLAFLESEGYTVTREDN
jgi:hypothetical protein